MEKTENRQYNLDILKAFAIIAMVICHVILMLGSHIPGYEDDFGFFFGDVILGDYAFVAHAFMFAMGVGMVYSKKGDPSDMLRRGIRLYLMGYVLNFFRAGLYFIIYNLVTGEAIEETWYIIFGQDILQFAGLAYILTAFLKKLRMTEVQIFVLSVVLSAVGSLIPYLDIDNKLLDLLIGHFVSTGDISCFTLFNWYICVAFGRLFGSFLLKIRDKDRFYKRLLFISGIMMAVYITLTAVFGVFFLTAERQYYAASTLEMMGLLSIDLFFLSLFYFILQKTGVSRFKILIEMSRNVNVIFIIHWLIVGAVDSFFWMVVEHVFTYAQIYLLALIILVVSVLLALLRSSRGRKAKA